MPDASTILSEGASKDTEALVVVPHSCFCFTSLNLNPKQWQGLSRQPEMNSTKVQKKQGKVFIH